MLNSQSNEYIYLPINYCHLSPPKFPDVSFLSPPSPTSGLR
jgi:hypothetical protein